MPFFRLETNVKKEDIPPNFAQELRNHIAGALGASVSTIIMNIVPDQMMFLGDEGLLCSVGTLRSIGRQGEEENIVTAKAISSKVSELGIHPDRQFITFFDMPPYCVGKGPTTVDCLRKLANN